MNYCVQDFGTILLVQTLILFIMPRFYCPISLNLGEYIDLPERVMRHVHVLRLQPGDELVLFNGDGMDVTATIVEISRKSVNVELKEVKACETESHLHLSLVQSLSSGERMEFTLQKCVELGVSVFQPIVSERCVLRLQGERADKRLQRWQEIVISACEQSGRSVVPQVLPVLKLADYLQQRHQDDGLSILLSVVNKQGLHSLPTAAQKAVLMAGPEGGFSPQEEAHILNSGFVPLSLGPRVLRTETAAMTAVSCLQARWGDFI